ncbi:preprotein translocase subunit SecG [Apibacter mensalis]|uniref:Protein-export membrane protein SecG n=1 Tax=Apibacter mensalis TaxID=1586267 RepID=A0A0X3ANW6_9FLAO|nr:preprotein translocase subunit SecG [Apibacter mensalis]CVK15847.1 preprotein translocase subunit SecG [Apibacter mensalis]
MTAVYGILMIFIIIACILLILVVLSQNPKGGGLSSTFGGSGTQMFGVQKTNDFMEKATWTLGGVIVLLSIFASVLIAKPTIYTSTPTKNSNQSSTTQQEQALPKTNVK